MTLLLFPLNLRVLYGTRMGGRVYYKSTLHTNPATIYADDAWGVFFLNIMNILPLIFIPSSARVKLAPPRRPAAQMMDIIFAFYLRLDSFIIRMQETPLRRAKLEKQVGGAQTTFVYIDTLCGFGPFSN